MEVERKGAKSTRCGRAAAADDQEPVVTTRAIEDYLNLLASIGTRQPATYSEEARLAVLAAFPDVWAAWLVVRSLSDIPERMRLSQRLSCTGAAVTDEMLELWLQRSAALTWHDAAGFGPLLAAYGTRCRPAVVHYVALCRPISATYASRLRDLAQVYGVVELAEWL
jgi:hypothetical protein